MRYKITVEYDGTNYCGFQRQKEPGLYSITQAIEAAIFKLSQEEVRITGSGRTDSGVHALGQVIHFDLVKNFEPNKIVMGLNNYLREEGVVVLECEIVDENFHARMSAKMRHYTYIIVNRPATLTLDKNRAHHVKRKLDIEKMQSAANFLLGQHDFSSFRDAECQASSPIRSIAKINISKSDEKIFINFSAKSFLHHMVRNIVGTLIWIGSGKIAVDDMKKILEAKNRSKSGPNAPACGLYFLKTDY
jgi:tRNA pseudouridine38-40 synthase